MFAYFYETLFREYILMEELTWLHAKNAQAEKSEVLTDSNRNDLPDLMSSYQQKISVLNDEIYNLKNDVDDRDREIAQLRIQYKILKQRSQSVDRNVHSSSNNDNNDLNRSKRGISVDAGGNLREQLDTSYDEIRLLKNKLIRLEDELNNCALEKETLVIKLDQQTKQGFDSIISKDLQIFTSKIGTCDRH
jgi:regulator of replication initiation timing